MNQLRHATNRVIRSQYRCMSTTLPLRSAILFPGQGSQLVGMGKAIYDQYHSAKLVFDEADEALGTRLCSLIFDGPQDALTLTENAQPAILTTSIALLRVLEAEFGFDISHGRYAMGHSLGEYTALVATKAMSLTNAVKLVNVRGKAMSKAVTGQDTAMSALLLRKNKLTELKTFVEQRQHDLPKGELVAIANINSSFQVVLSGTRKGVDQTIQILQAQKIVARAVDLPVSAPFHCSLMKDAADVMEEALKQVDIKMPCIDVISNVTAKPYTSTEEISKRLVEQVVATVEWERSISFCRDQGVNHFVCLGPGKVLGNLLKKEYPKDTISFIENAEEMSQLCK